MEKKPGIGIQLNKDCPNILYVMFADDYIIFCKATKTAALSVRFLIITVKFQCQLVNLLRSKI